jgi:hypothetical protein
MPLHNAPEEGNKKGKKNERSKWEMSHDCGLVEYFAQQIIFMVSRCLALSRDISRSLAVSRDVSLSLVSRCLATLPQIIRDTNTWKLLSSIYTNLHQYFHVFVILSTLTL